MRGWYTPQKVLVCVQLAGGDHKAGVLLHEIMLRYPYAKATLPGKDGRWSANTREVWFQAAGLSRNQGDRALALLETLDRIERAHGPWDGNLNVLHVRPTRRALVVWHTATTFLALDTVLGGNKNSPLHQLWQAWPGATPDNDPETAGVIANWYEELHGKMVKRIYRKQLNLKPCALDLLQLILESDPTIADADADDLLGRLEKALSSITIKADAKGGLVPVPLEAAE